MCPRKAASMELKCCYPKYTIYYMLRCYFFCTLIASLLYTVQLKGVLVATDFTLSLHLKQMWDGAFFRKELLKAPAG